MGTNCAVKMSTRRSYRYALLIISAMSCGGGPSGGPPVPTVTSVSVIPASANVQAGTSQQFMASVFGTGDFPTTVRWSVSGNSDDGNLGTISSSGLYASSGIPPNPNTVTVKATSTFDPSKSGTATIVVGSAPFHITGIAISPTATSITTAQNQQFTATVQGTGSFSTAVNWFVDGFSGGNSLVGTISASGLYTPPGAVPTGGSVTVQVVSAVDSTISATAQVAITQGPPTITQLSPSSANASDSVQIMGSGFVDTVTVIFPGPNGIQLAVLPNPNSSSPSQLNLVVPLSTVSGGVLVQVQSQGGIIQQSNSVTFTRLPRVRIRAAQRDLSAGESASFQSRILGTGTIEKLDWSADVGSITTDGIYTAPTNLTSDTFAEVTACIQSAQICDQERLGLHPFRINPAVPIVALGNTLQLSAIQGSATINPIWQLNGPGALSPAGLYTASSQLARGGGVPVTATYSGVAEQTSIGVTGAFPGIVNRISDYVDMNQAPFPLGTWAVNVGMSGNNAYVLGTDQADFVLDQNYYWIDVYDASDPTNPVWTDAFEPAARGQMVSCDGFLYQITDTDYSSGPPYPGVIAVYDISGAHPALLSRQISPVIEPAIVSQSSCLFSEVSLAAWESVTAGQPVLIDQLKLQNGSVIHTQASPIVPSSIPSPILKGIASNAHLLFLKVSGDLIAYDLTTQPPSQVGFLSTSDSLVSTLSIVGNLLFMTTGNPEVDSSDVFDISTSQPTLLTTLPAGPVLTYSGSTAIAGTSQTGLRAIDVSNPQAPKITGAVFDYVDAQYTIAPASGGYVLSTEGDGGLAVYDMNEPGGLFPSYLPAVGGTVQNSPVFAQAANSSNIYFAVGNSTYGGGVLGFDLSTKPPTYVSSFSTGASLCQALALGQKYLYVGATDSLRVLDVSNPASPTQVNSITQGISALATIGNTLFAGTVDDHLDVFDISQPSTPSLQTSLGLPALPIEIVVSGNLLLVADSNAGLLVYNISVPSAPVLLSQTKPSKGGVFDVAVDGNLALLAAWEGGLVIVDLTNPATPQILGQASLNTIDPYVALQSYLLNKAATVALLNKIAFVGVYNADPNVPPENGNAMIYGFDYTEPAYPRLVYLGANGTVADAILTLRAAGSDLFAGTTITPIDFAASQPQDVVNLFFLPDALRPPVNSVAGRSLRSGRRTTGKHNGYKLLKRRLPFCMPARRKYAAQTCEREGLQ